MLMNRAIGKVISEIVPDDFQDEVEVLSNKNFDYQNIVLNAIKWNSYDLVELFQNIPLSVKRLRYIGGSLSSNLHWLPSSLFCLHIQSCVTVDGDLLPSSLKILVVEGKFKGKIPACLEVLSCGKILGTPILPKTLRVFVLGDVGEIENFPSKLEILCIGQRYGTFPCYDDYCQCKNYYQDRKINAIARRLFRPAPNLQVLLPQHERTTILLPHLPSSLRVFCLGYNTSHIQFHEYPESLEILHLWPIMTLDVKKLPKTLKELSFAYNPTTMNHINHDRSFIINRVGKDNFEVLKTMKNLHLISCLGHFFTMSLEKINGRWYLRSNGKRPI